MPGESSMRDVLLNLMQYGDLSFRDFVELALYHPEFGYYAKGENPVGKGGDYITAPSLSPAFSFAIAGLVREFLRACEGEVCSIVDIGCGDGGLIRSLAAQVDEKHARFFGVDRALSRAHPSPRESGERVAEGRVRGGADATVEAPHPPFGHLLPAQRGEGEVRFVSAIDQLPKDGCHLFLSNELFDAFPFARLVQRGEHLHELWVSEREGGLDWSEHEAPPVYDDYFAARGVKPADGQFVDLSTEWDAFYDDVAKFLQRGLIVTIDYGFPQDRLFDRRIRRFGTAAAYSGQRVSRDLLANPGEQDLTAHINFTDLERAGERNGMTTLLFERLAKFLLALNITEHELFRPLDDSSTVRLEDWEARDEARRLVLPDGIGEDLRVLIQGKGVPLEGWAFQKRLF